MARIMILILVVTSLTLVHAEASSLSAGRVQQPQELVRNFLMTNYNPSGAGLAKDDFVARSEREYDENNIDFERLKATNPNTRYDIVFSNDNSSDQDGAVPVRTRQAVTDQRNMAQLVYGMPQFRSFNAIYQPEKRSAALRHSVVVDRDDRDYGLNSLAAQIYREPLGRSTEKLVQRLRDQLQAKPLTREKKMRRCQFDPNLGIKSPSSCDTDSYFGAADYAMRNVWDSAGRR